jgi:hypothetical protein
MHHIRCCHQMWFTGRLLGFRQFRASPQEAQMPLLKRVRNTWFFTKRLSKSGVPFRFWPIPMRGYGSTAGLWQEQLGYKCSRTMHFVRGGSFLRILEPAPHCCGKIIDQAVHYGNNQQRQKHPGN